MHAMLSLQYLSRYRTDGSCQDQPAAVSKVAAGAPAEARAHSTSRLRSRPQASGRASL